MFLWLFSVTGHMNTFFTAEYPFYERSIFKEVRDLDFDTKGAGVAAEVLDKVLAENAGKSEGEQQTKVEPVIKIDKLTKYYGKKNNRVRGIEGLSLTVDPGEICGFIGPNGAGKTTAIRTLMGLIFPDSGSAEIFGMDCSTKGSKIAASVGYLPGEGCYYSNLTVKDMLRYAEGLYHVNCRNRAEELADKLKLNLSRKVKELSFGNRKKVGIVQALMHSPKLLIMDEPTVGLDPLNQQMFIKLLKEEKAKGVTVLFSSHILGEVQRLCDTIAIIKEGRIVGRMRIDELNENGYKRVLLATKDKNALPDNYFIEPGITSLEREEDRVTFLYQGSMSRLMNKLQPIEMSNLSITDPSLEEIFLHYYN